MGEMPIMSSQSIIANPTRRTAIAVLAAVVVAPSLVARAEPTLAIHVTKQPTCGCCNGWIEHLQKNGFTATVENADNVAPLKARLGVPPELASCHTAVIDGYVIEGHVPADAIRRLLKERPQAIGLSAPGMPIGSPGMETGTPEVYDVVLFSRDKRQTFGRYKGERQVSE